MVLGHSMSSLALVVLLLPLAGSLVMHLSTCQVQHQRVAQIPPAQTRSCSTPLMLICWRYIAQHPTADAPVALESR